MHGSVAGWVEGGCIMQHDAPCFGCTLLW